MQDVKAARDMGANEYQKAALRTLNGELSETDVLINSCLGLGGEAGEVMDLVKKHLHQGHDLDKHHLARELGDVAWYLAEAAYAIGYDLSDILRMNVEKLEERFPNAFESTRSINRSEDDI